MKIPLRGGSPVAICDAANVFGASWAADGTIWFAQPEGVFRVAAEGGRPERMIEAGARERLAAPQLLPDGRTVLCTSFTQRNNATIAAYSTPRGARITGSVQPVEPCFPRWLALCRRGKG